MTQRTKFSATQLWILQDSPQYASYFTDIGESNTGQNDEVCAPRPYKNTRPGQRKISNLYHITPFLNTFSIISHENDKLHEIKFRVP